MASESRSPELRSPDPTLCPLCRGDNHCARVRDPSGRERCWCVDEVFPRDLLDQANARTEARVCVCSRCLRRFAVSRGGDFRIPEPGGPLE